MGAVFPFANKMIRTTFTYCKHGDDRILLTVSMDGFQKVGGDGFGGESKNPVRKPRSQEAGEVKKPESPKPRSPEASKPTLTPMVSLDIPNIYPIIVLSIFFSMIPIYSQYYTNITPVYNLNRI